MLRANLARLMVDRGWTSAAGSLLRDALAGVSADGDAMIRGYVALTQGYAAEAGGHRPEAVTAYRQARRLYAAAHQPKTMIEVEGAGHTAALGLGAEPAAIAALVAWTTAPNH